VFRPDQIVPISQMPATPSGPRYQMSHGRVSAGDPEAMVYQRTWDCCGILMTGLYTTLVWNAYGSYVYTTNQWNTTVLSTTPKLRRAEAGGSITSNSGTPQVASTAGRERSAAKRALVTRAFSILPEPSTTTLT
jgi:hypothetical protein